MILSWICKSCPLSSSCSALTKSLLFYLCPFGQNHQYLGMLWLLGEFGMWVRWLVVMRMQVFYISWEHDHFRRSRRMRALFQWLCSYYLENQILQEGPGECYVLLVSLWNRIGHKLLVRSEWFQSWVLTSHKPPTGPPTSVLSPLLGALFSSSHDRCWPSNLDHIQPNHFIK